MEWQRLYRRLRSISGIWLIVGFACTVLFFALGAEMQIAKSDDLPDLPPSSAPLPIDAQTFATNVARGDAGEAADQQIQDAAIASASGNTQEKSEMAIPTIPGYANPTPGTGIFGHPQVPGGWAVRYHITNEWDGAVNGNFITAYAGSKADDPYSGVWDTTTAEQGMLRVQGWTIPDFVSISSLDGEYLTATRTGVLTITSQSGACLCLISTDNTNYQFNLEARTWSCSVNNAPPP